MMTPRSRARNTSNQRYGSSQSPIHQRGGGIRGGGGHQTGCYPPTINIVDSSGYPQHQMPPHHGGYPENDFYDAGYHNSESSRGYVGSTQPRFGVGHSNDVRAANSSLPTSPSHTRSARSLASPRADGTTTSTSNLPAGGGAGAFYWAAKVWNEKIEERHVESVQINSFKLPET